MNDILTSHPKATCGYCGQPNVSALTYCASCGTQLAAIATSPPKADSTTPRPKSKLLAIGLALVFGPLGLLYVRARFGLLMMAIFIPLRFVHGAALWVTFGSRVLAASLAYVTVNEIDTRPNARRDAGRLLNRAAKLENVDREMAITVYEQIVELYPDTKASREAANNIQILRQHQTKRTDEAVSPGRLP